MNSEYQLGVLVDSVMHYFENAVQQPAACGIPHLAVRASPTLADYTGIVRISGRRNGMVVFTAPRSMLCVMLMCMQDTDLSHENLCELVGKIATTLSGDAQRNFRHQYSISVRSMVYDRNAPLVYPPHARPIVIPIDWRSYQARLVVCLGS